MFGAILVTLPSLFQQPFSSVFFFFKIVFSPFTEYQPCCCYLHLRRRFQSPPPPHRRRRRRRCRPSQEEELYYVYFFDVATETDCHSSVREFSHFQQCPKTAVLGDYSLERDSVIYIKCAKRNVCVRIFQINCTFTGQFYFDKTTPFKVATAFR